MISSDQITSLATKFQTTELNIRREYIQHLFLSYFYQQEESEKLLFKGGTALRIIHASPRFSEDLDFDYVAETPIAQTIEKILQECMVSMEKEGIGFELEEAKETSGGYLTILHVNVEGQLIKIQLEISSRDTDKKGEVFSIVSDFIPTYTVVALETNQLVTEKLEALLDRKKARDFYDLYYVLRKRMLPKETKKALPEVLEILKSTEIHFDQELKEFLPRSQRAIIANFREALIAEVKRNIS
jgi:predicted nucleotidyltransferase component of viral defense system